MMGVGAPREISPSPRQHLGVAPWVLRKSLEFHASKVCPKLAQRGGGICHGLFLLPLADSAGRGYSSDLGRKIKGGASPYSSCQKNKKDSFPSTSWQVGARLPPVWTYSPKRNSNSISLPLPTQKFTFGRERGRTRDSSLRAIAMHWASDIFKTLPSIRSRQNNYYFMEKGKVSQECEGGGEGPVWL